MDNNVKPYVSVLMPAYNAGRFIGEAIESILNQSYGNYEFLIIEDGSGDSTRSIVDHYQSKDNRIRVLYNGKNKGLIYSLNRGLDIARGKYIARMDADDVSLPHRLETQVLFMDANEEIAVSSAWMKTLGRRKEVIWKSPLSHHEIMAKMFSSNCLWHPVSIIRKDILDSLHLRYDSGYVKSEDYKLWMEIAKHEQLANLPEVLHRYRIHDAQETRAAVRLKRGGKEHVQNNKGLPGIRQELLTDLLSREITSEEAELHAKLFFDIPFTGKNELDDLRKWVDFLISVNRKENKYIEPGFSRNLQDALLYTKAKSFKHYCNRRKRYHPGFLWKLFFSESKYYSAFSKHELMMLVLNTLMFRKNKKYRGVE